MTARKDADTLTLVERVRSLTTSGRFGLPPLPEIAQRLLELLQNENSADPRGVAELIQNDPALASSVLRLANSASFGGLRAVQDLSESVARLGLRQITSLVTVSVQRDQFVSSDPRRAELLHRLWDQSIATAVAARQLAVRAGEERTEAFLAGLLHDSGCLLVLKAVDELEREGEAPITTTTVDELFDALHTELGERVLREWRIPEPICVVARRHHDPTDAALDRLTLRVQAADAIARKIGLHLHPEPDLDLTLVPAVDHCGLDELELAELLVDIEDEVQQVKTLF
ncbi:MAG: HDOD domain-containing protein [Candidatus Eisenbacteria bacterium]|uniref:HDOD domain-containing protein n=1 Tax=Eiseniibacteriota bacterium TaxID=2212470 RepID=A0A849SN42_UNCEI|nr:HDOD domain-containing protein [Candidatus Eisenbacteria bacterium]